MTLRNSSISLLVALWLFKKMIRAKSCWTVRASSAFSACIRSSCALTFFSCFFNSSTKIKKRVRRIREKEKRRKNLHAQCSSCHSVRAVMEPPGCASKNECDGMQRMQSQSGVCRDCYRRSGPSNSFWTLDFVLWWIYTDDYLLRRRQAWRESQFIALLFVESSLNVKAILLLTRLERLFRCRVSPSQTSALPQKLQRFGWSSVCIAAKLLVPFHFGASSFCPFFSFFFFFFFSFSSFSYREHRLHRVMGCNLCGFG